MIRETRFTVVIFSLLLAACQTDRVDMNPVSTGGAADGHLIGQDFNAVLNNDDRIAASHAEQRAFQSPLGQPVTWSNPESGASGSILPLRDGYAANGNYCREFQKFIVLDSQQLQGYSKACQKSDGSWTIIE